MNRLTLRGPVLALLLACNLSCALVPGPESAAPRQSAEPQAVRPGDTRAGVEPAVPRPVQGRRPPATDALAYSAETPLQQDRAGVPFGRPSPSLTETLQETLDSLAGAKTENRRLEENLSRARDQLQEKERTIADLREQLSACDTEVKKLEQALEKWKDDVLGFRDEMRQAEEAELTVLQQILSLLKSLKKEPAAQ